MNQLQAKNVNFYGGEILGVRTADGKVYMGVRKACRDIGLTDGQARRQVENVRDDIVLSKGVANLELPTNGGIQEVLGIEKEFIPLWLAKISLTPAMQRDNPGTVDRLIRYQLEAKNVLAKAFLERKIDSYMIEDPIQRAQRWIQEETERQALQQQIHQDRPKIIFADAVSASNTSILIGDLAKLLKQNGIDTGQKRLFKWLRDNNYLIKRRGSDYNSPTQYSMNLGLFEIKETAITHSDGHVSISKTPKVTGKDQQYFINKFKAYKRDVELYA
jgi:anti-repressor protein